MYMYIFYEEIRNRFSLPDSTDDFSLLVSVYVYYFNKGDLLFLTFLRLIQSFILVNIHNSSVELLLNVRSWLNTLVVFDKELSIKTIVIAFICTYLYICICLGRYFGLFD